MPELRETICNYYRDNYGATIDPENVMVFAGGRPALMALMLFLRKDVIIRIAEAEYAGFYGILEKLGKKTEIVESNESNNFRPANSAYMGQNRMAIFSNPCNPTGITKVGADL